MLTKLIQYAYHWFRCRLICQWKLFKLKHVVVDQPVSLGWKSIIFICKESRLHFGPNIKIHNSILHFTRSNGHFNDGIQFKDSRILIHDSEIVIGENSRFQQTMLNVRDKSNFISGKHFSLSKRGSDECFFYATTSIVSIGVNVNLNGTFICEGSKLTFGSNIFINSGTQLRCMKEITLGSNILISYDCIIFDTNTHSIEASDRRQEMVDGYPNEAIQLASNKANVKTAPIVIGDDNWIGTRAIILKGTHLGNDVIVGAASVLSGSKVPNGKIVTGNPGKWN